MARRVDRWSLWLSRGLLVYSVLAFAVAYCSRGYCHGTWEFVWSKPKEGGLARLSECRSRHPDDLGALYCCLW